MSDELAFPYEDLWYIKLINESDKNPLETWGGYSQDFEDAENVYTHEQVVESDHEYWGIVGIKDVAHTSRSLLIFDLDIHKAPDDFDGDRVGVPSETALVKSQSGGFHVPFVVTNSERGSGKESDFQMTANPGWDIDIRGSYVSHHVVAPNAIPGVGGKYELVRDEAIQGVLDPGDAAARITLDGEPLLEHERAGGGSTVDVDRSADPPEEMPTCYHRGLQVRKANPDDPNVNTHQVNTLTALCGLAAGYDIDTMVGHFCEDFKPGENADETETRYQLKTMARKMERDEPLAPPAISTLREYGILDEDETCNCDIDYHGSNSRVSANLDDEGDLGDEVSMKWEYVRGQYAEEGKQAGRYFAAQALEERTAWMHILEEERLWVYDESSGTFGPWGRQEAAKMLERGLGEFYSRSEKGEVIDRLMSRNQTRREEINGGSTPSPLVCVGNGVVNLENGEIEDHSPEHQFTRGLKWDYKPETADTESILEFTDDITTREADRDTIIDHLAHGLMPGHPYRAFIMMYGPGGNGKTQLGQLLRGFVGGENAASVELSDLTGSDDFATGALPGKFINVGDDVGVSEIRDASALKRAAGGGTMRANEKNEKQFDFENEAAMFFSANEPPRITEDKDAIAQRLYPIEMPYQFKSEEEYDPENPLHKRMVPGIADDLLENEAAMEGLLALCVEHGQDLIASDGQYSMPEGPSEPRLRYEAASDPIARFAFRCFETGDGSDAVIKDDAYTVYKRLCEADDERTTDADTFKRMITQLGGIDVESSRVRGLTAGDGRDRVWKYVRFSEDATEYMSERLRERYFPEGEWDTGGDEEQQADDVDAAADGQSVFGAVPVRNAAETLTGYVTVTVEIATTTRLDNGPFKAIAKDGSGAIDIVAWDSPFDTQLEDAEGETVAIENVEVTEYEGTRQLVPVEGLTEISHVQQGVGHTAGEPTSKGQAALDGGQDTEIEGMRGKVLAHLRKNPKEAASVASVAGSLNESPGEIENCLEHLAVKGTVTRRDGGYTLD